MFVPSRHSILLGLTAAAVCFAGSTAQAMHGGMAAARPDATRLDAVGLALVAASALPLIGWWRSPGAVFVLTAVASTGLAGLGYPADLVFGPVAALYLVAAGRRERWPVPVGAVIGVLFVAYLAAAALARPGFPATELLHTGLAWAAAWFAGERTRLRREQLAEFRQRALRAERDAERDRLLAVAEERTRIARDLHDSAGHAISLIAVRAGAARLRHGREPDRTTAALQAIEDLARATAGEIERTVTSLRDRDRVADLPSPVGLASLPTLAGHHQEAGLPVVVGTHGEARPLAPAVDQAAYRIVQEALTNAGRHGAGRVEVEVRYGDEGVGLTVSNALAEPRPPVPAGPGGHGLIGIRERAALLGGTIETGPAGGRFVVRAELPYDGRPA